MKRVLSLILALLIVFNIFSVVPFSLVSASETENTQSDYIYYSDLFYGYSGYLKSNELADYDRETYNIMSNVFGEYVDSEAFELAAFSETLNLFSSMSEIVKAYSDLFGITNFQYKDDLDAANKIFVTALFDLDMQSLQTLSGQSVIPEQISGITSLLKEMHETVAKSEDEINFKNFINNYLTKADVFFSEIRSVPSLTSRAYEYLATLSGTANKIEELYDVTAALLLSLAMEDIRLELIGEIARTQQSGSILYEGMNRLYSQIDDGFLEYFAHTYFDKGVINSIVKKVGEKISGLISGDVGSAVSLITSGVGLINTIVFDWIAGDYIPSFSDYRVTMILAQYSNLMYEGLLVKQEELKKSFTVDEILQYKTFFNAYISSRECAIEQIRFLASCNVDYPPVYVVSRFSKWQDYNYESYINGVKAQIISVPEEQRIITPVSSYTVSGDTVISGGSDCIESGYLYAVDNTVNINKVVLYDKASLTAKNGKYIIQGELHLPDNSKLIIQEDSELLINGDINTCTYDHWWHGCPGMDIFNYGKLTVNGSVDNQKARIRIENKNKIVIKRNVNADEFTMVDASATLEVAGNLYAPNSNISKGTVLLNGTTQQEVDSYLNVYNLIIDNPCGVKYNGSVRVYGTYNTNGNPVDNNGYYTYLYKEAPVYDGYYGKLYINGDMEFEGNYDADFTVGQNCEITVPSGKELTVNGSIDFNGSSYLKIRGNSSVTVNGNINYVGYSSYRGYLLNNGNLQVNGSITYKDNRRMQIENNSKLAVNGNVDVDSITMTDSIAVFETTGNLVAPNSNISKGTVLLNGTTQQEVGFYLNVYNLIIDNPCGVKYNGSVRVYGTYNTNGNPVDNNGYYTYLYKEAPVYDGYYGKLYINGDMEFEGNYDADFTVGQNCEITVPSGKELTVNGSIDFNGSSYLKIRGNSSVTVNGNINYVGYSSYRGYLLNNGNLQVNGSITYKDNRRMQIENNSKLAVNGNVDVDSITMTDSIAVFETTGNLVAPNSNISKGTVLLNGTTQQEVGFYLNVYNLIIDNPCGVKYNGSVHVYGTYNTNGNPVDNNGYYTYLYKEAPVYDGYYGKLYINGDMEFEGNYDADFTVGQNCEITVPSGKELTVNGSIDLSTSSYLKIRGNSSVTVNGNINYVGSSSYCGYLLNNGNLQVNGSITYTNHRKMQIENNSKLTVNGNVDVESITMADSVAVFETTGNVFAMLDYISKGTVILNGMNKQTVYNCDAPIMIIGNRSSDGVVFNSSISPSVLFNHNGNNFTLYNNGSNCVFSDYDEDGLNDNVDPVPCLYNKPGDADYNGEVNAMDLSYTVKFLLLTSEYKSVQNDTMDINKDKIIDVRDLVGIKNLLAGTVV